VPHRGLWGVWEAAVEATKAELGEAQIGIPYPQMDLHVQGSAAVPLAAVPAE